MLVEPINADSIGEKVKTAETDVEDPQFLRGDSYECWFLGVTDGEPLPERPLGFRYSKYANSHKGKISRSPRR